MNKSILIAMADFLVLAALSLSTGIDDFSSVSKPKLLQELVDPISQWEEDPIARLEYERELDQVELGFQRYWEINLKRDLQHERENLQAVQRERREKEIELADVQNLATQERQEFETAKRALLDQLSAVTWEGERLDAELKSSEHALKIADERARNAEETKSLAMAARDDAIQRMEQQEQRVTLLQQQAEKAQDAAKDAMDKALEAENSMIQTEVSARNARLAIEAAKKEYELERAQVLKRLEGAITENELKKSIIDEHRIAGAELTETVGKQARTINEQQSEVERLHEEVAKLRGLGSSKLWGQRNEVRWEVTVEISETSNRDEQKRFVSHPPAVNIGAGVFLVSDFRAFGANWGEVEAGEVTQVRLVVGKTGNDAVSHSLREFYYYKDDPRLWLVKIPNKEEAKAWKLHGTNLMTLRLNELRLWKVRSLQGLVSDNISCNETKSGMLQISSELLGTGTNPPDFGDLVVTNHAEILGVVIDRNLTRRRSECIILPADLDESRLVHVSLDRQGEYCKEFVKAAEEARKKSN